MSEASTTVTIFESLNAVVQSSRPFAWFFAPMLFGIGLIHSRSRSDIANKSPSLFMTATQAFSLSFPLCIIVFGMNDVYDYDTDIINPRKAKAGLEGGILFPVYHSTVRLAAYLSTVLILFTSLLTGRTQNVFATALVILGGWQYSAPPLRLKEIPLLDSFSNGLGIFFGWLVGYTFGCGRLSKIPRDKVFILSLCTAGMHALAAAVDVEPDSAAGQTTIATYFGRRVAAVFGVCMFFTALAIANGFIVKVHLWGGTAIMLAPCLRASWTYYAFQTIVYWSLIMTVVWFGSNASMSMPLRSRQK